MTVDNRNNRNLPPAAIPVAAARACKKPITTNGVFGKLNISSVTMPARCRIYIMPK